MPRCSDARASAPLRATILALVAGACTPAAESTRPAPDARLAPASAASTLAAPTVVTLLYTSDEHGWVLPTVEKQGEGNEAGRVRGGAAELLGRLVAHEGHCPGKPPPGIAPPPGPPPPGCADPGTLLLSGGDNWTGPAISSFFAGAPMAEAMARMGYAASAFGNHELDFGAGAFAKNRAIAGYPYLAANLRREASAPIDLDVRPFVTLERRGVQIAVVGAVTEECLTAAKASHYAGYAVDRIEPSLAREIPRAWESGADAVVLVAHECPDELEPMVARHPEWRLSFVGGGHCHRVVQKSVGGVPLVSPGWKLQSYVRVRLAVDRSRPPRERVVSVEPRMIEVAHARADAPAAPDPAIAEATRAWQAKLDAALGEPIGFTATGLAHRSPEIGRWVTGAWRAELGVDVAIVNRGGLRQALPEGAITKASVYSVLPFDNTIVVLTLSGSDLVAELANGEAIAAGVRKGPGGAWIEESGRPIDPDARYRIATIDFLYQGGSGFGFRRRDPAAEETGIDWRAPVIEWTKKRGTSAAAPLERLLR